MMRISCPSQLPAKSAQSGKAPRSLLDHSLDAEEAACSVFRLDGRWGQNFCRFFGLEGVEEQESFLRHLRIAALFHDLGKANEEFVDMVLRRRQVTQTLRHEHISGLVLCVPSVRRWLEQGGIDVDVITAAVLSHHLKAEAQAGRYTWGECRHSPALTLWLGHPDVRAVLERVQELADLSSPPELPTERWVVEGAPWNDILDGGWNLAERFRRALRTDDQRKRLHLAVKAGLIAADSVASALIREGHEVRVWVEDVVHREPISENDVWEDVIEPRCRSIAEKSGSPFVWDDFQDSAAVQPSRCLLLAACGAGKTLAAWRWAASQCGTSSLGKVVFLYPTRGTATEGFRDYVGWAPEADAALMHGTSRYELDDMLANPSEALQDKDLGQLETEQRLFALGFWSKRFFSATVDQFLAFLEHHYESLCMLPVLADSAVIIDEVHSFSPPMFDKLVSFLEFFRGPVLCMTATLPGKRIERLEECGLTLFPARGEQLEHLSKKENAPRYDIQLVSEVDAAFDAALRTYCVDKLRVLWVVNTVARCQALVRQLEARLGTRVLVYHSRFRLVDRQRVHAETVNAFQQDGQPVIAVTTQVCEMSLDLDAHVLITELAPFTSLVQRFGRANRKLAFQRAKVYVYEPENHAPYRRDEMTASRELLGSVCGSSTSQAMLAGALERYQVPEDAAAPKTARFLEAGYYATPGEFRGSDDYGVQAVLDEDVEAAQEALRLKRPIDGLILSVPRKLARPAPGELKLPSFLHLADATRYDERLGFLSEGDVSL